MTDKLHLECFAEDRADLKLRPAPHRRDWMDASSDGYAYRCLPLAIANAHGWEALTPGRIEARWNGGKTHEAIDVRAAPGERPLAVSHFGEGVLTFHIPCLFRTPPGYDLFVMGPTNRVKAHIQPLNGVVETDWSPFSFTMNWIFTTPGETVVFEKDEPVASFFPIQRGVIERFEPVMRRPEDDPDFWGAHMAWRQSRETFNQDLHDPESEARAKKWQKTYINGPEKPLDTPHRTRLRLADFQPPKPTRG